MNKNLKPLLTKPIISVLDSLWHLHRNFINKNSIIDLSTSWIGILSGNVHNPQVPGITWIEHVKPPNFFERNPTLKRILKWDTLKNLIS